MSHPLIALLSTAFILARGGGDGLVLLVLVGGPTLYYVITSYKKYSEERNAALAKDKVRRQQIEVRKRQERIREEWERSPEGQAALEQRRREKEEAERIEQLRLMRVEEERVRQQRIQEEDAARMYWDMYYKSQTMGEIASMTGLQFEQFLARLLSHVGYTEISMTPINDQGGDLVAISPDGIKIVVQAKRWKCSLGNGVVQELLGAMLHYECSSGMIITNSVFTASARQLAAKAHITLCDGQWLRQKLEEHFPSEIPKFNMSEYEKNKEQFHAALQWFKPKTATPPPKPPRQPKPKRKNYYRKRWRRRW